VPSTGRGSPRQTVDSRAELVGRCGRQVVVERQLAIRAEEGKEGGSARLAGWGRGKGARPVFSRRSPLCSRRGHASLPPSLTVSSVTDMVPLCLWIPRRPRREGRGRGGVGKVGRRVGAPPRRQAALVSSPPPASRRAGRASLLRAPAPRAARRKRNSVADRALGTRLPLGPRHRQRRRPAGRATPVCFPRPSDDDDDADRARGRDGRQRRTRSLAGPPERGRGPPVDIVVGAARPASR